MKLSAIGITPQKEKQFNGKGIFSVEDMVRYLPRKYNDFSRETGILPEDQISCLIVTVNKVCTYNNGKPLMIVFCETEDGKRIFVKWFHQNYLAAKYEEFVGHKVYLCAKLEYSAEYDNYSATSPEMFEPRISIGKRIIPVYSKIPGMSMDYLSAKMEAAVSMPEALGETLPPDMVADEKLLLMREALYSVHFPQSMAQIEKAHDRLLLDDMVYFAMSNEYAARSSSIGSPFNIKTLGTIKEITENLPYQLTKDQKDTVNSMIQKVREGKRLNALVQGDVGCGKTIVAILMMAVLAENGYQAVLMAPTQVLAKQHYADLCAILEPVGFHIAYLGSNMKVKEKKAVLASIASGEANIIVGTHSVIGKSVEYKNLGITVTDEEHKFGVAQRAALVEKAAAGVHSITMSATPIPRTLGLLMYGDLDISILDELPPGRKPVKTRCITGKKRADLYGFLDREIDSGRQVYIVCPAIEDAGGSGLNAVKSYYEDIAKAYLPDRRVGLMHGKLKPKEKAEVMDDFKSGRLDALVSTTVIEVGVDVPNATVMVIENAERYGLSALHQLRGRVGRGAAESWCFLVSDNVSESVQKRLKFLCSTSDGFAVAQYDLETRGPGDFFGSRQHGLPTLQIADLMNDTRTLHAAQSEAVALLAEDPLLERPEHALLARQVEQMFDKAGTMN